MLYFLIIGLLSSGQTLSFTCIAELNPLSLTSTALSIISVIIMLCSAASQPVFGWLLKKHSMLGFSALINYQLAMFLIPTTALLGFIAITNVKKNKLNRH
jgi:hypothetical protein